MNLISQNENENSNSKQDTSRNYKDQDPQNASNTNGDYKSEMIRIGPKNSEGSHLKIDDKKIQGKNSKYDYLMHSEN